MDTADQFGRLLEDLGSTDVAVRADAARKMGELGDPNAIGWLEDVTQTDRFQSMILLATLTISKIETGAAKLPPGRTAREWLVRIAGELRQPKAAVAAVMAFDALGVEGENALVDEIMQGGERAIENFAGLGTDRMLAWVVARCERASERDEVFKCIMFLENQTRSMFVALLERFVTDLPASNTLSQLAEHSFRERGLPVPHRKEALHANALAARTLSHPIPDKGIALLIERLARAFEIADTVSEPRTHQDGLEASRAGMQAFSSTTRWSCGAVHATMTSEGEWNDHGEGGAGTALTIRLPNASTIALDVGLTHYELRGESDAAAKGERIFRQVLAELGWSAPS